MRTLHQPKKSIFISIIFIFLFFGLGFLLNYSVPGQAAAINSSTAYPPPVSPVSPAGSTAYPPPPPSSPVPSPIPSPTPTSKETKFIAPQVVPVGISFEQAAKDFIAQRSKTPVDQLVFDENYSITLPLSNTQLWLGWLVDLSGKQSLSYQVLIDSGKRTIITGSSINPESYWSDEEALFKQKYQELILNSVAQKYALEDKYLQILNGSLNYYQLTGSLIWKGKIFSSPNNETYEIALNTTGVVVNLTEVENSEKEAQTKKFGKLTQELYYYLKYVPGNHVVKIILWVNDIDQKAISNELLHDFPQVKASYFANGIPFDEKRHPIGIDKNLSETILKKYLELKNLALEKNKEGVISYLKNKGYVFEDTQNMPMVSAELSAKDIFDINSATVENLIGIYNSEFNITYDANMDLINQTIRTNGVWDQGYTGSYVPIGIVDGALRTDISHPALAGKIQGTYQMPQSSDGHASMVAGVLAGNDTTRSPAYKGVAFGNYNIYSTSSGSNTSELAQRLNWLVDNTSIINGSISYSGTRSMEIYDRIYDYISRDRKILFVIAAGNLDQINNGNVTSPGKAYNVLTVGGFNTNETSSWNDDSMWDGSCYIDPYIDNQSTSGDRNKPEVVAVGKSVEVPNIIGGGYSLADGTSVAAPQVSGLATLLIQQNWMLAFEPSALKSIIMASAIHNIEGDPKLSDHDGTGAIVVSSAFDITNPFRGAYDYEVWDDITSLFSQSNNYIDLTSENMISGVLFARKGERVRTVISWESNPSSNYSTDPLSSDLDLYAYAPSGSFVQASISNNNNYEILDFTAPETGEYKLKLHYIFRSTEGVNLGFGLAWWRSPDVFLPVIINNP